MAYAEICEGGGFGTEKTIALSGPGNGQKLQKLGLHSKTKCYAFKNILQPVAKISFYQTVKLTIEKACASTQI